MIIECINCSKKFDVDSNLIPSEGRTIQCGSCNHVWFFKKKRKSSKKQLILIYLMMISTFQNQKKYLKKLLLKNLMFQRKRAQK